MDLELTYSSVVFNKGASPAPEKQEEPTIYAEVKNKQGTTATGGEVASRSCFSFWLLCSGGLFILLVACIIIIIYTVLQLNQFTVLHSSLTAENERLTVQKKIFENQAEDLNWTLGVILEHREFPVDQFCPNKRCQPCRQGWTQFRDKCYLFYDEKAPWKTWQESRTYCNDSSTDLVIIDDLEEQEFLSRNVKFYHDLYHGFWFGLVEKNDSWFWTDGRNDTLRFWITKALGETGLCAMMIPTRNATENWDPSDCKMRNKFICEGDVLIRTTQTTPGF